MIQTSGVIWMECGRAGHPYWSCFNDFRVIFFLMKSCTSLYTVLLSPNWLRIKVLIVEGWNSNNIAISTEPQRTSVGAPSEYLKFQHWTEIEKDNTKKWKWFSVSLNRFELDDVSDLKIIDKLVLKLLMSLRVSQKYSVLHLSY